MNAAVHWPADEKIIGVLGLAPLATADFYQKLSAVKTEKDWQYPRVIIDSNPKIPSRGRHLELGETSPVPFMRKSIANLAEQGADLVAVPCNTAHILYSQYAKDAPVYLPNIIKITVSACLRHQAKKVLILASKLTIAHKLYQDALLEEKMDFLVPEPEDQILISGAIEQVKQNAVQKETRERLVEFIKNSGADTVILGCTELPVLLNFPISGVRMVDSCQELATHCLEFSRGGK